MDSSDTDRMSIAKDEFHAILEVLIRTGTVNNHLCELADD